MVASDEGAGVQMHVLEDAGHWVSQLWAFAVQGRL
jgi:hypothetical protein